MIRVLHVIPAVAPRYGGPSVATVGMCRALLATGTSVLIAATDADGSGRLPVPLRTVHPYAGIPAIFFRRRFSEAFKWSAGLRRWLRDHVTEFDVAHVHAVFSHSSIAAGAACRAHGIPYILRPLGTLDPWSVGRKPLRKKLLLSTGGQQLIARAAAVHYTTAEEQRLAESVLPLLATGVVVPLGVEESFFADRAPQAGESAAPYVLALSRLDEKKGIDVLIGAFRRIADVPAFRGWRLVIAGDGAPAYVAALKTLAGPPHASRIEFTGWIDGEAKRHLMRDASLYALPSQQENFGISVVEAMALGVPVLVTPGVNLAPDIRRQDAGWVTSERSETAVAESLAAALTDGGARRRRGANAAAFAAQFRWHRVADQLNELYASVMGRA